MPQSARAGFADGDRFADEGGGAFVVDLSFHREGEARLDDDISVVRGLPKDRWTLLPVETEQPERTRQGERMTTTRESGTMQANGEWL